MYNYIHSYTCKHVMFPMIATIVSEKSLLPYATFKHPCFDYIYRLITFRAQIISPHYSDQN